MPPKQVYQKILQLLQETLTEGIDARSLERLALLVIGIIAAKHGAPAQIARALRRLRLSPAQAESLERRIRRLENDPEITAEICVHPFARWHLRYGKPQRLWLIVDATTQEDRVVLLTISVWYRGRALPLVWTIWEANTPLTGKRFWERVEALLTVLEGILPVQVPVIIMADRAFGTPAFIDLVTRRGWQYIVRVQGQTLCCDRVGRVRRVSELAADKHQRGKMSGSVFKKAGWREANVVVYQGNSHQAPVCLVSNLPLDWRIYVYYRRRFGIEAGFRDYKSHGWEWEQGQVTDLAHMQRLLVGMALATWVVLCVGAQVAAELLSKPPTGRRYTRPYEGKFSLFTHGLDRLQEWLQGALECNPRWQLTDWEAPNWEIQIRNHHAFAFVFKCSRFATPSVRP